MSWTNIAKPTGTGYTRVNPQGREIYDDQNVEFDSSSVFYDGIDQAAWTDLAKPGGILNIVAGMATGLLMPVTYSKGIETDTGWININKPT